MGVPIGYSQLLLPRLLLPALTLFFYVRTFIISLFPYTGPSDFLEPDIPQPNTTDSSDVATHHRDIPLSALLFRELLPVVKFSDLVDPPDSCAVCFDDFETEDEIRRLTNCRHVFHRSCLDRWIGYDQRTCPLCRNTLITDDMEDTFNDERL